MFGLFKRRDWQPEILDELEGSYGDIKIAIFNMPFQIDKISGKRTYAYPDFGCEFINELDNQLGRFEDIHHDTACYGSKKASINLRDFPIIEVELSGTISRNKRQFYSDISDALIDAFESQDISP